MKAIIKAMGETEFKPRAKWWGYVSDGKRYLMRYHHNFAIFSSNEVLYSNYETRTDKTGVEFAIKYFKQQLADEIIETYLKLYNSAFSELQKTEGYLTLLALNKRTGKKTNKIKKESLT